MSTTGTFPLSGEFGPVPPPPVARVIVPEPPVRLTRLLLGLAVVVGTYDLCFWKANQLGISLTLFTAALTTVVLINREKAADRRITKIILGLLVGASLATIIESGATNVIVLLALMIALAGHTYFTRADSFWGRGLSQLLALLFAPGRIFWLGARLLEAPFKNGKGSISKVLGGLVLALPAVVLTIIFGWLLATGNTVFGSWTNSFFDWLWKELEQYLNAERILVWIFIGFLALPLLRPTSIADWWWRWTERLPRLPEIVPAQGAFFSSALVLIVLNVLFFVANIADAIFLWSGDTKLPAGVTYSGYVHNGVNALTITVILSAVILTFIFQQALLVAGRRELKFLAYAWIAQNLFLLNSVALRLKLYIEAYDMTVERLSVIIFLVLVASGFGLLTAKIVKDWSLSWLIGGCAVVVFVTLYITQFLNLAGWSANYNVTRWVKDRGHRLDTQYLYSLGPDAWPALHVVREIDTNIPIFNPDDDHLGGMQNEADVNRAKFDGQHWREFSLRAWLNSDALEQKSKN